MLLWGGVSGTLGGMCCVPSSSSSTEVMFTCLNLPKVDMVIEEVAEINMALLPVRNTDLLWRICQVGAAGKT